MTEKTDVDQQLVLLIQLQGIDAQIYKLIAEKRAKPQEIEFLKDSLALRQSGIKDAETALRNLQVKRKEKEIDLETKEGAIKKLQVQLYQLKTNKEYAAMLHEIESQKADKSLLEDDVLKLMEAIDFAEAKLKGEKDKFAEESEKTETQIKAIEDEAKRIEAALAELKTKRGVIAPSVNPRILKDYERILVGKVGLALVEVINDACGGCYMHLPPQVINEIRMKENIIYCESCRRMLYIKDEQA